MIEVFKTNVEDQDLANRLVDQIHSIFLNYQVNFDLEDKDKILRVECTRGVVNSAFLIHFLKKIGINAEVLADEYEQESSCNTFYNRRI